MLCGLKRMLLGKRALCRSQHSSNLIAGDIWIVGGFDISIRQLNDMWKYSIQAGRWRLIAAFTSVRVRTMDDVSYRHSLRGLLWQSLSGSQWQGRSWTHLPRSEPWPSARSGHSVVADAAGRQLFLFGGHNGSNYLYEFNDDFWKFEIEAGVSVQRPQCYARVARNA